MKTFKEGDNVLVHDKVVWGTKGCTMISPKKLAVILNYNGDNRYAVKHETSFGAAVEIRTEDEMQLVTFENDPEVFI